MDGCRDKIHQSESLKKFAKKIHRNREKICNLMVLSITNLERYIKIEKKNWNLMASSNQKSDGRLSR